eukprot:6823495-Pyramimonas_sp.AAC.1
MGLRETFRRRGEIRFKNLVRMDPGADFALIRARRLAAKRVLPASLAHVEPEESSLGALLRLLERSCRPL